METISKRDGEMMSKSGPTLDLQLLLTEKESMLKPCIELLKMAEAGEGKKRVWWWRDNHSIRNRAGFPDLMVWVKNRDFPEYVDCLHIELKKKGEKQSPSQKAWQAWFADCENIYYYCTDDYDEFKRILRAHDVIQAF